MGKWLVALLEDEIIAPTAREAVEHAAGSRSIIEFGHTWFAVPVDADGIETFRIGAERFVLPAQITPEQA